MDVHAQDLEIRPEDLERAQLVLESYMFPNTAQTEREKDVLRRASRYQAAHDLTLARETPNLPADVRSFQIGHFQMTMEPGARTQRAALCPSAYALLLREGLLYRGVEGRHAVREAKTTEEKKAERTARMLDFVGSPPLRPGVRGRERDAWLPHRKGPRGNPPPPGIAPQGMPPLPGLPRNVRTGEGIWVAADGTASDGVPHPPVSP